LSYPFSNKVSAEPLHFAKSVVLLILFWLGGQIAAIVIAQPVMQLFDGEFSAFLRVLVIVISLIVGSGSMAIFAMYWTVRIEGRSLWDIGLRFDAIGWQQYRTGLTTGFLFALALMMVAAVIGIVFVGSSQNTEAETVQLYWQNLADPGLWLLLAVLFVAFVVQGGAEEIVCRGWLLSDITRKANLVKGVVVSSLLFAFLHIHLFFINGSDVSVTQMLIGSVGILAMFAMGLMLAMVAMRDRSIMGACGLHSGFNFSVLALGIVFLRLASEEENIAASMVKMFEQSTSLSQIGPGLVAQVLLAFAVAWILLKRFGLPRENPGQSSSFK